MQPPASSSNRIMAWSRAKVNLALQVLYRRKDGFHEIETIFQSINLYDELDLEFHQDGEIAITTNDPDIPTGAANLCHRAVVQMRQVAGPDLGARIHIRKRIPHSAGLGGGSSNAAAVILGVNACLDLDLSTSELEKLALGIGSDVPFMIHGGTMFARGRGEKLTKLEKIKKCFFLIVKPSVDISTKWVYDNLNLRLTRNRYRFNLNRVNTILTRFPEVTFSFRNDLENVVCPAYPQISGVLDQLLALDPRLAAMSGSGSALFAIFDEEAKASGIAERFSLMGCFTAVVEPSQRAVELNPT
jgi:4-diphosphocytidyl-2-C-methyl-D-erythritol kinase